MADFNRLLGFNLKRLRKSMGLTQAQLAERLGLAPTYFGRVETGEFAPSMDVIEKLCEALNVSPTELFAPEAKGESGVGIYLMIGQNIAARRKQVGLTQVQLAHMAGLTENAVNRIENGKVAPRRANLEEISKALGCSIDELGVPAPEVREPSADDVARLWTNLVQQCADQQAEIERLREKVKALEAERLADLKRRIARLEEKPQSEASSPSKTVKRGG